MIGAGHAASCAFVTMGSLQPSGGANFSAASFGPQLPGSYS